MSTSINKFNSIKGYWDGRPFLGNNVVKITISTNNYKYLLRCLLFYPHYSH